MSFMIFSKMCEHLRLSLAGEGRLAAQPNIKRDPSIASSKSVRMVSCTMKVMVAISYSSPAAGHLGGPDLSVPEIMHGPQKRKRRPESRLLQKSQRVAALAV
jgi:hypothetical protein